MQPSAFQRKVTPEPLHRLLQVNKPPHSVPNKPGGFPSREEGVHPPAARSSPLGPRRPPPGPGLDAVPSLRSTARKGRPGGKPVLPQPPGPGATPQALGGGVLERPGGRSGRASAGPHESSSSSPSNLCSKSGSSSPPASPTAEPAFLLPHHTPGQTRLHSAARF